MYAEELHQVITQTGTKVFNPGIDTKTLLHHSNSDGVKITVCRLGVSQDEFEKTLEKFFGVEISFEWEDHSWEKDIGSYVDDWGNDHPIYRTIECWIIHLDFLPSEEDCVEAYRRNQIAGKAFDPSLQTLEKGHPLYYCEVYRILTS